MSILIDTGIFVAAADTDEPRHADCAQVLLDHRPRLMTTAPVVAESAWLIEDRLGPIAEATFVNMILNDIRVVDLTKRDYRRCEELIRTYADMGLGLVDASIVAIAERLTVTTVATLNHATSASCARRTVTLLNSCRDARTRPDAVARYHRFAPLLLGQLVQGEAAAHFPR